MTAQQKSHKTHKNGSETDNKKCCRSVPQVTQKGRFWVSQVSHSHISTTGQHGHSTARPHLHTQRTHDGPSVSYCSTDPHCYLAFVPNTNLFHGATRACAKSTSITHPPPLHAAEKRLDPNDGGWYDRESFGLVYRGTEEWDAATTYAAYISRVAH